MLSYTRLSLKFIITIEHKISHAVKGVSRKFFFVGGATKKTRPKNSTIKPPSTLSASCMKIQEGYGPLPLCRRDAHACSIGTMFKFKPFLPKSTLLKVFLWNFTSPLTVWTTYLKTNLSYIPILLMHASKQSSYKGKAICGGHCRDHVTPFYSELKILKLPDLGKLVIAKIVYEHSRLFTNILE